MTAERNALPGRVVWTRRLLVGSGVVALGYAVSGAIASPDMRLTYLRFLAGVLIGHDLVLLPTAIVIGVLIGRLIPAFARAVVQSAMFISLTVAVVALPAVLGFGRTDDLPSALPRDYGRGLLVVLGLIWLAAAAALVVKAARTRVGRSAADG